MASVSLRILPDKSSSYADDANNGIRSAVEHIDHNPRVLGEQIDFA